MTSERAILALSLAALGPLTAETEPYPHRLVELRIRDPFILADAATREYYLYAQTGNRLVDPEPNLGVEVYRSHDLVNWSDAQLAFERPKSFWGGEEIWAPEVHHLDGKYYLFVTFKDVSGKRGGYRGSQILRADSPEGPFHAFSDEATTPPEQRALDATPYVDREGQNWMVYCHEWAQIVDGAILAVRMAPDWSRRMGEPITLFHGTEAPWVRPFSSPRWMEGRPGFVTDGPAFYRTASGKLLMLWSSFGKDGYAVGIAESACGDIQGPWTQQPTPLFVANGGHTMLFRDFNGRLLLALHQPNGDRLERPRLFEVEEKNDTLVLRPTS
jgi:arabinan endo-1,5-alpha-L-arabinosidase